jgi:hypothetical protein
MRDLPANRAKVEAISSWLLDAHLLHLRVHEFSDSEVAMEIVTFRRK